MSQSPQTGQFNSYDGELTYLEPDDIRLNPLKRVNSILTELKKSDIRSRLAMSQSPQTGQFNSYL